VADPFPLARLLQLASPLLPVGAYCYSQGLEWAVEEGTVVDAASARSWIGDALRLSMCRFELPILKRLLHAWSQSDEQALADWNAHFCAGRDTAESRAETLQMGYSLVRLLRDLEGFDQQQIAKLTALKEVSFPLAYACAATTWNIPQQPAMQAYAWSWTENQVSAAMKTVPLGQVAGQRILLALGTELAALVEQADLLADDEICNFTPRLTLAGCRHETQYSRLFRS
jgi:urease accessory protein